MPIMPNISIIVPVYNAACVLKETLDSIENQTFNDWECVIVNDGSKDNSLSIIEEYAKRDKRFVCYSTQNSGCADIPRTFGVIQAQSKFVLYMDADDVLSSDYICQALKRLQDTNADIVFGQLIGSISQLDGELYRIPLHTFDKSKIIPGRDAFKMTIDGWAFSANGMLVNKSLYHGIIPGCYMNSDEFTSRQVIFKAKAVAFHNGIYKYRNHNASISRKLSPRLFERLIVDKQIEDFVNENYFADSDVAIKERRSRFFNMVNLQALFDSKKKHLSKEKRKWISCQLIDSYNSQDFNRLRKELRKPYVWGFCTSYTMYRICVPIYCLIRKLKGKTYYYS